VDNVYRAPAPRYLTTPKFHRHLVHRTPMTPNPSKSNQIPDHEPRDLWPLGPGLTSI